MPVRIYALAKELDIDSKQLVDICKKAGITGKGSALASLSDEETSKLKSFLSGGSQTASRPAPAREPAAPDKPQEFTREDYISPSAAPSRPKVIESPPAKPASPEPAQAPPKKPKKDKEPVIKLAAMPEVKTPAKKEAEPLAAQQPVMRLPQDAIRGAREGSSAPLEQFTRQTDRKRKGGEKKKPEDTTTEAPSPAAGERPRRRGKDARRETEGEGRDKGLAGMASARAARQDSRRRKSVTVDDEPRHRRLRRRSKGTSTAAPRKSKATLTMPCTVRSFCEATGLASSEVQRTLMTLGNMVTINAALNLETAEMLAAEFDVQLEIRQQESVEEKLLARLTAIEDAPESLIPRPPVVTFLGHVDHGKTSLLDSIIGTKVVAGEAGGITQHIRAYEIDKDGRNIAFVDTPGHEAFTEMRARGANVTDIAVLVVAADDGIMPQTEEAISHARAADVPIVVALNKIDLPGADVNKAMQDLSTHGLLPQEWGGDVEVVKTSAITGEGIDDLLETILLTADLHEYKANPERAASGTCLEAQQEGGRGVVAKMIVQNGTLHVGDIIVCGGAHGRVKAMYDTLKTNTKVNEAGPSTPVNLTGLDVAPEAGQAFYVLEDIAVARQIAEERSTYSREMALGGKSVHVSFEEFQRQLEEGVLGTSTEPTRLNLILRADVRGSIEAIQKELGKLDHPEVQVRLLQATVGGITVADVTLADASDAVIIGFNVIPDEAARQLADERGVEIRRYDIIYKVTEEIRALLEGKLEPEKRATDLGRALVQQVFTISRVGAVAGCRVLAGTIERGCRIRVNRDGRGIGDYALDSLRRVKDDVKEVREGMECGIKLSGFNDLKEGDILEAYKIEEFARSL